MDHRTIARTWATRPAAARPPAARMAAVRRSTPRMTRRLVALLAVAAVMLVACGGGGTPSPSPSGANLPLEGTTWQLTEYVGAGGGVVAVPDTVTATATFADGTLSGNGGCNQYSATYVVGEETLAISEIRATQMACTGPASAVETPFLAILPKVATFSITGDTLELLNASGTITLRFRGA